jgi:hypothetical protein
MTKEPLISLAMMVKDEEEFLAEALISAKPWVDELVVVDTGSTDRTVEIAKDHGAIIHYFEWCDSFSLARNETIRVASGEWVFILDADERIRGEDPDAFRKALKPGPHFPFESFLINVINVSNDGRPISSGFGPRVFPRHKHIGYGGRVHNRFRSSDPENPSINASYLEGLEIIHLGYDQEIYKARKKTERSLPLILASIEDDPNDGGMRFYLGREYMRCNDYVKAADALAAAIEVMNQAAGSDNLLQASWVSLIDASRLAEHPLNDVLRLASQALRLFPKNPDLWNATSAVLLAANQPAEAIKYLSQAKKNLSQEWSDAERSRGLVLRAWELDERLALAYGELGQWEASYKAFIETIAQRPKDVPGWEAVLDTTESLARQFGDTAQVEAIQAKRMDVLGS